MVNMKKILTTITFGFLIITMALTLVGCAANLEGQWVYKDAYGLPEAYIEFRANGSCSFSNPVYGKKETTYTIDSDGTLHFNGNTYKKTTVEEMRKMDSSQDNEYYAFDGSSAYFGDNTKEYKKQ